MDNIKKEPTTQDEGPFVPISLVTVHLTPVVSLDGEPSIIEEVTNYSSDDTNDFELKNEAEDSDEAEDMKSDIYAMQIASGNVVEKIITENVQRKRTTDFSLEQIVNNEDNGNNQVATVNGSLSAIIEEPTDKLPETRKRNTTQEYRCKDRYTGDQMQTTFALIKKNEGYKNKRIKKEPHVNIENENTHFNQTLIKQEIDDTIKKETNDSNSDWTEEDNLPLAIIKANLKRSASFMLDDGDGDDDVFVD